MPTAAEKEVAHKVAAVLIQPKTIGQAIRRRRFALHMTVRRLAVLVGCSAAEVYALEADRIKQPGVNMLIRISKVLDCYLSDLIDGRIRAIEI